MEKTLSLSLSFAALFETVEARVPSVSSEKGMHDCHYTPSSPLLRPAERGRAGPILTDFRLFDKY